MNKNHTSRIFQRHEWVDVTEASLKLWHISLIKFRDGGVTTHSLFDEGMARRLNMNDKQDRIEGISLFIGVFVWEHFKILSSFDSINFDGNQWKLLITINEVLNNFEHFGFCYSSLSWKNWRIFLLNSYFDNHKSIFRTQNKRASFLKHAASYSYSQLFISAQLDSPTLHLLGNGYVIFYSLPENTHVVGCL